MQMEFGQWLLNDRGYSTRVTSNICSRLRRAEKISEPGDTFALVAFRARMELSTKWSQVPKTSKSGILRAVRLYESFLIATKNS